MLDAELNFSSNGDSFKGDHLVKKGFEAKYSDFDPILLVYLADIRMCTYFGFLIDCVGCRI